MSKTATIRARTDESLKHEVESIFERIGLTTSQALNIFYRQIVMHNGLPFDVAIPNKVTKQAIDDARKGKIKSFSSVDTLFDDLDI